MIFLLCAIIYQPSFSICLFLPQAAASPQFPPLLFLLSEVFPNLVFDLNLLGIFLFNCMIRAFLSVFAEVAKLTVSFVMFLYVEKLDSCWMTFNEILRLEVLLKSLQRIQMLLKLKKNNRHSTCTPTYICNYLGCCCYYNCICYQGYQCLFIHFVVCLMTGP